MGKLHQIFMELSACNTIMAGYYSLMFLFLKSSEGVLMGAGVLNGVNTVFLLPSIHIFPVNICQ